MQFARLATQSLREKGFAGLSLTQIQVLKRLCRHEQRASDLATALGVTPAAITKLIDQLYKTIMRYVGQLAINLSEITGVSKETIEKNLRAIVESRYKADDKEGDSHA